MEKKFGNRSSMYMMLGYVHKTTKIWRIRDFKLERTRQVVECSSVVFDEEENTYTEEQMEAIDFPDTTDEAQTYEAQEVQTDKVQEVFHQMNNVLENTIK